MPGTPAYCHTVPNAWSALLSTRLHTVLAHPVTYMPETQLTDAVKHLLIDTNARTLSLHTYLHTRSWTRIVSLPPSPPPPIRSLSLTPLPSPRWGQTPEGLPTVSPLGPGPTLILLAHPVHRGLVGDVSLPMHGAVAPPCSASS